MVDEGHSQRFLIELAWQFGLADIYKGIRPVFSIAKKLPAQDIEKALLIVTPGIEKFLAVEVIGGRTRIRRRGAGSKKSKVKKRPEAETKGALLFWICALFQWKPCQMKVRRLLL